MTPETLKELAPGRLGVGVMVRNWPSRHVYSQIFSCKNVSYIRGAFKLLIFCIFSIFKI